MPDELSRAARRVQEALDEHGLTGRVVELPASTRSAAEAAAALGCRVDQIAKSLVFRGARTGDPLLVIASGTHRVDPAAMGGRVGEPVALADPDTVRSVTGYAIGGVPPVGHREELPVYLDHDLMAHDEIWAAAGTPNAVFRLTPAELERITGAQVVRVVAAGGASAGDEPGRG